MTASRARPQRGGEDEPDGQCSVGHRAGGGSASLEAIAQRAGVSIATLYRHFPVLASLIEAVLREDNAALVSAGERLERENEPLEALLAWIEKAVASCSRFRGLAEALMAGRHEDDNPLADACHAREACGTGLLAAAQAAGGVRPDVTSADLFDLIGAAAWLAETGGSDNRLLRLVRHGILTVRDS
ncbi:TetR/AcrR family transcriptional regulator [Gordonia sp. ABSL11-1]|uniref:TetR/AcrR family transcriptional regulator n=1 Tax=Gordonia sp. ABSL11-1 TaxID=3053924 RepID=UPI002573CE1F|nr:TetR/AcrR family transcriptional regulator [Gordonia sp. ABSL11-1]MDL9945624.1 TetR/AcrR family transcriptional regulator [Gordonia sp. ABSL11-1]